MVVSLAFSIVIVFMMTLNGQVLAIEEYENAVYSYMDVILVLQQVITIGAVLPIFLIHRKYLPKPERKNTFSSVLLGVMFALGCCVVTGILQSLVFELFSIQDSAWLETEAIFESMSLPLEILATVILAPIVEELMLRGMVMNRLMSRFPKWVAVVVSAVVFGVLHLNLTQGIFATITGLILGFLYLKTRSLLLCILAHAANNLYATLFSYVNWSSDIYALLCDVAIAVVTLAPILIIYIVKRNKKSIND